MTTVRPRIRRFRIVVASVAYVRKPQSETRSVCAGAVGAVRLSGRRRWRRTTRPIRRGRSFHPPRETCTKTRAGRRAPMRPTCCMPAWDSAPITSLGSLVVGVRVLLLRRREIDQPVLRGVGWAMSLAAFSTLVAMAVAAELAGAGGGRRRIPGGDGLCAAGVELCDGRGVILALSVLLAGLLLCTDYLLLRFAAKTTVVSGAGLMQAGPRGAASRRSAPRARRPTSKTGSIWKTDDESDEEEGD